jgi:arylsulfatase B
VIWSTHLGTHEPDYDADNPILRSSQPVDEPLHLTSALTREAASFIERHREQPFFLCLTYNAVHSPMQAHHLYLEKFKHLDDAHRRIFAAMLTDLDVNIGQVLLSLERWGLDKNTLVVFLSDNGGPTRELTSSNHPLRGEKGQLFEGGIRVPFLMRWPVRLPAGHVEPRMVSSLDIFATSVAAAGTEPPKNLDGVDLTPRLIPADTAPIHEQLYWRVGQQAALRQGDWKIHCGRGETDWQLFQVADDIAEAHDRAASHPEKRNELEAAWKVLDVQMTAPLWGAPPSARKVP